MSRAAATIPLRHRLLSDYYRAREHPGRLRLLRWLKVLLGVRIVRVEVAPGVVMELDDRDYVGREILFHGGYELRTLRRFDLLLADARGFVDIGAHHGQYTLRAARALAPRSGRVVAFEPMPLNAAALLRNAALSGLSNIDVFCTALGAQSAMATMAVSSAGNSGSARLDSARAADTPVVHVVVQSLADLLPSLPESALDLVKIDVEGREVDVLRPLFSAGARPKNLLLEFLPGDFDYGLGEGVPAWLDAHGYDVLTVDGTNYKTGGPLPDGNLWARLRGSDASRA